MRLPKSLESLVEEGVVSEVIRPLMSGKEAQLYLVIFEDRPAAAKVYKEAQNRSFKHRADYMEGRKVRNTRDQRAMQSGSKYGRAQDEEAWRATEVDMIYRLHAGGVRVPVPYTYLDGVLVMELVTDAEGQPAPRLGDLNPTPEQAVQIYHHLIGEVVRMLAAGVVHGDLSDFNVLIGADGPVVIDFPQSILAANNQNARTLLLRDVANLHRFVQRFAPGMGRAPYAEEMWKLYESNRLAPDTVLTGRYQGATTRVDTRAVMQLIGDANRDEQRRRERSGLAPATTVPSSEEPTATDTQTTAPRRRIVEVMPPKPPSRGPRPGGGRPDAQRAQAAPRQQDSRYSNPRVPPGASPRAEGGYSRGAAATPALPQRRPKSGPKRGDNAQASTYVSPAARNDTFRLTPRSENVAPATAPAAGTQETSQRKRRRRRGGKNRPQTAAPDVVQASSSTSTLETPIRQASQAQTAGETTHKPRRRRPRNAQS
ncbi:MAG: hypothetical protein RJA70_4898 [Pseudomonadota bacterium]|jgi:RIO kinase 1